MLDADLSVIRDTLAAGGGVIATRDDIDAVLTDLLPPTGLAERGVRYQTGKPWTVQMPHDWPKLLRRMPPAIAPGRDLGARRSHRTPNARGNTVKPLTAEAHLAGCWRVRLGDYRLIYRPDLQAHRVDVIAIRRRAAATIDNDAMLALRGTVSRLTYASTAP